MNLFERHLETIKNDSRFYDISRDDSTRMSSLSLWVFDLVLNGVNEIRLMYGWIVPVADVSLQGWSNTLPNWQNFDSQTPGNKYRFGRVVLNSFPSAINRIIVGIGEGLSLEESCVKAGLEAPKSFGALRLGANAKEIDELYIPAPVRFLYRDIPQESLPRSLRPLRGPSETSPAFLSSISRLYKTDLWSKNPSYRATSLAKGEGHDPLPNADDVARNCLEYLSIETGLRFKDSDGRRFGDLEWLNPTATNEFENEYVSITIKRNEDRLSTGVCVSVKEGPLDKKTRLLIRCRLFYGEEIGLDECRPSEVGDVPVEFPSNQELGRVLVTIWKLKEDKTAEIWFEKDLFLVRQVSFGMGIIGTRGRIETNWSSSMASVREKIQKRIQKVSEISHTSYSASVTPGSWSKREASEREINDFVARVFPEQSEAAFFLRGWQNKEPGFLGLVEWFQKLTEEGAAIAFVIVDPYFDDYAVGEFLSRVRGTQGEYIVLTNTQISEKDRAKSISDQCKALWPVLMHLNLSIIDLQSKGKSTEQLFHDRYILVYGQNAKLIKGFNLSNSLQGATKRHPILVTPIPAAVLDDVGEYVSDLRKGIPSTGGEATVVTLFSTFEVRKQRIAAHSGAEPIPNSGVFFSILLDQELRLLEWGQIETYLRDQGALEGDGNYQLNATVVRGLERLFQEMVSGSFEHFTTLWTAFAEWRARVVDDSDAIKATMKPVATQLAELLTQFILEATNRPPPFGTKELPYSDSFSSVGHLFFEGFDEVLKPAQYLERYPYRDFGC